VQKELKVVIAELSNGNKDIIDFVVKNEKNRSSKVCVNGHLNQKVRGNRKYCTTCKSPFIEINEEHSDDEDGNAQKNEGNFNK
jgi:hypothetical protein